MPQLAAWPNHGKETPLSATAAAADVGRRYGDWTTTDRLAFPAARRWHPEFRVHRATRFRRRLFRPDSDAQHPPAAGPSPFTRMPLARYRSESTHREAPASTNEERGVLYAAALTEGCIDAPVVTCTANCVPTSDAQAFEGTLPPYKRWSHAAEPGLLGGLDGLVLLCAW